MFDLRYHVASLAAVFLALIIGILVGVGISGRGLVDSRSAILQDTIASRQRDSTQRDAGDATAASSAARRAFVEHDLPGARWTTG